jgi:hypothetical protein
MRFCLLLCGAALGIVFGTEARAAAGRDYEVTYYAEPQLRTQVGTFYKPCGAGAATLTGHRTRYFTKSQSACPGGGGIHVTTLSCRFTQAGCTDALAHGYPIVSYTSGVTATSSLFQVSAADRELYKKNQRDSGVKGK